MLSCSWRWKIPGMGNRRDLDGRKHDSTMKISQRRRAIADQQMPVREPTKKEENATRPPLPPFTRETAVQNTWSPS